MKKTAILLTLLHITVGANLPDQFKLCHVTEPETSSCLKVAVQDALQRIGTTGIPSLNLGPLEPMFVKEVKVDQGGRGPVSVKLQFTNLKIYGIPESSVTKFALNNYEMKAESLTPEFKFEADYVMDGQVLVLPIKGKGRCVISLDSLTTIHDIRGKPVTRGGETYLDLEKYIINMSTKKLHLSFKNLFNGDKALGDTMNTFLNENWEVIFTELRPALERAFGNVFLEYSRNIFNNVPFNNIFLP
ncbi:protein takeout-like [Zootermopsis nevadensis]|uniref:protein takeout-like n=1 Tax=Zootermopsis nevadensis TaxID=136037 RepID=UPI000B8E5F47|nr:protein takeout-like [Zootermopsis nevadensis]